ncbi:MAG: GntR family transcriptional regulator [Bryobacteraceae bacterium]
MRKNTQKSAIAGSSLREDAYRHILKKIASGELVAGTSLSEVALARELGSSRTPIREAIGQLVAEGWLTQTPNRGAVVVQLTRRDIVELYELREALEVYEVGRAARAYVPPEDLDHLRQIINEMALLKRELERSSRTALNTEEMRHFVAYDLGYHSLLVRLGGNARILKVVNETRLLIRVFSIHRSGHDAAQIDQICNSHTRILEAVANRDSSSAMSLLSEHIRASSQERLDEFDHWDRARSLRSAFPTFLDVPSLLGTPGS